MWISALKLVYKLIGTFILTAITLAFIVVRVREGYSSMMHLTGSSNDVLKSQVWGTMGVGLVGYLAVFTVFSLLVGALWFLPRQEDYEQAARREAERESSWMSSLKVGSKLIGTLILAAITLALLAAGGLFGGYLYVMQPNAELKAQVGSDLQMAIDIYFVVFAFCGYLVGALWFWKPKRSEDAAPIPRGRARMD